MLLASSWIILEKFDFFAHVTKNSTFWWRISWPGQVFPWSNWAETQPNQSSKIVFKYLLRIYSSMKFIYYKYGVKGWKSRTSARTSKITQRPVQRQRWGRVLRTICLNNQWFLTKIICFSFEDASGLILDHFRKFYFFAHVIKNLTFWWHIYSTGQGFP